MKMIIVGCGEVGRAVAVQLQEEDIDLTLIDQDTTTLETLTNEIDAMGIVGNGADINVLKEADVTHTELLAAITPSDELNLLCCVIAQEAGCKHTIARVRNPIFSKEIAFLRDRLGIDVIVNPELAAATEISRLLRFPSAIKIDTFARGRIELLKFRVQPEFGLDRQSVIQISEHFKMDILICAVERRDMVSIPDGNFVIENGDYLSIIASPLTAAEFFRKIGLKTNQVKNCMILGGGKVGLYLADALLKMKIDVKIFEKNRARCEELTDLLPNAIIINGDATDRNLLMTEGLLHAEALVSATDNDEENIFTTLYAKKVSHTKKVVRIDRLSYDEVLDDMDLGSIIYPKYIIADHISQYVRAMQNSIGSNVETLYHILDGRAEALAFKIREKSGVAGIPLSQLKLKKNILVCCITRNEQVIIPRGQDTMEVGDSVIIVTINKGLRDVQDILA